MKIRLPKGKLFSSRRYGQYGTYMTWNMLETLALLAQPPSDDKPIWTARTISKAVKMSYQPALLMLERMKKKNWVEWGKDENGKQSWIVTPTGIDALILSLHHHVNFELRPGDPVTPTIQKIVFRARRVLKKLKFYGWQDIQARECLINYRIEKIEWAISKAERKIVENKGAYTRALIENGNMDERRCRVYVMRACPDINEGLLEMVVKEALRTSDPFEAVQKTIRILKGHMGKPDKDLNKRDLEEVMFALYKYGKVKSSARALQRFAG